MKKMLVLIMAAAMALIAGCAAADDRGPGDTAGGGPSPEAGLPETLIYTERNGGFDEENERTADVYDTSIVFPGQVVSVEEESLRDTEKKIEIDGDEISFDYTASFYMKGDRNAGDVVGRYGTCDSYSVRTDDYSATVKYLCGTDIITGFSIYVKDEEGLFKPIKSLEEAEALCLRFRTANMRFSLDYETTDDPEETERDGCYYIRFSKKLHGYDTNDCFTVCVSQNGYIVAVSGDCAGISSYTTLPSLEEIEQAIEALRSSEVLKGLQIDESSVKIWFGNDRKNYISVEASGEKDGIVSAEIYFTEI